MQWILSISGFTCWCVGSAKDPRVSYWKPWSKIYIVSSPSSWILTGTSAPSSSPERHSCNFSAATCPRIRISPARSGFGSAGPSAASVLAICEQEWAHCWPAAARARASGRRRAASFGPLRLRRSGRIRCRRCRGESAWWRLWAWAAGSPARCLRAKGWNISTFYAITPLFISE